MSSNRPLPPSAGGLPILGETLAFLTNPFGFIDQRTKRLGPVFKTNLLMRNTAVIVGADAADMFIDARCVQRSGAMPPNVSTLFGGKSLPTLDGAEHRDRKMFVMAAFTHEALAAYVPELERIVAAYVDRWKGEGEIRWVDQLKDLSLEAICRTVIGLEPGPTMDEVRGLYDVVFPGFVALPIPLPATRYTRAKKAVSRILDIFVENIERHRTSSMNDGLSRMLSARRPDGRAMRTEELKTELHHIVIAGIIVWAWMVTAVLELDARTDIKHHLIAEVRDRSAGPLSLETLDAMPYLAKVVDEIRRTSPVVPIAFGKAREEFEFRGFRIPKGWMVLWAVHSSHMRPDIYSEPERFDPERFSPERAEHTKHRCAFVPTGAGDAIGGHKCAGYEFAPNFLKVFLAVLLRSCSYELAAPQDLSRDWTKIPPEPKDGLRVRVRNL